MLGLDLDELLVSFIKDEMHPSLESVIILLRINLGALGEHLQGYLSSNNERIETIIPQGSNHFSPKVYLA